MAVLLLGDFDAARLRGFAKKTKDGPQARRLLALITFWRELVKPKHTSASSDIKSSVFGILRSSTFRPSHEIVRMHRS